MTTKRGRGRSYLLRTLEGFRNEEVARAASYLDELRERVYDQIGDLLPDALNFEAGETKLSIGRVGLPLGWGEFVRMREVGSAVGAAEVAADPGLADVSAAVEPGSLRLFKEPPPAVDSASAIISLCRRVRDEVTIPALQQVDELDQIVLDDGSNIRGIMNHLQWHRTYHSGHIGLIRFE